MANDDMNIRQQSTPLLTPDMGRVNQVTRGTASAAPAVAASSVPGGSVGLPSTGGGPVLELPKSMNPADLLTMLYALQKKTNESRITDAEMSVHLRSDDKKAKSDDLIKKLKKIAHKKPKKAAGIFAKVFAWVRRRLGLCRSRSGCSSFWRPCCSTVIRAGRHRCWHIDCPGDGRV